MIIVNMTPEEIIRRGYERAMLEHRLYTGEMGFEFSVACTFNGVEVLPGDILRFVNGELFQHERDGRIIWSVSVPVEVKPKKKAGK